MLVERALELRAAGAAAYELGAMHFTLARALAKADPVRARSLATQALDEYRKASAPRRIAEVEAWLNAARRL